MSFRKLYESIREKEFNFRIKFVEDLSEDQINALEDVLEKYDLIEMTGPKKTIVQEHPLDFNDIDNAEVFIFHAKTREPVSSYILLQEIRTELDIPEKFVVVRTDNDPLELETERVRALRSIEQEAKDKGYHKESLLSVEPHYQTSEESISPEPLYGDEANKEFREYLAQIAATRRGEIYQAHDDLYDVTRDDIQEYPEIMDDHNFNAHIEDAPYPVYKWNVKKNQDHREYIEQATSDEGNFDDDTKTYSRPYRTKDGKLVTITKSTEGIRARSSNEQ